MAESLDISCVRIRYSDPGHYFFYRDLHRRLPTDCMTADEFVHWAAEHRFILKENVNVVSYYYLEITHLN